MKLYYFGLAGRAEAVRIMLKLGGQNFEDIRFDFAEWGAKYKALSPTGQCPWMELDDGTIISQSPALIHYAGRITGLLPEDPLAQTKLHELLAQMEDAFNPIRPTFAMGPEEKVAARQAAISPGGKMYDAFMVVEKMISSSKTAFYQSEELGAADICLFCNIGHLTCGFLDGITSEHMKQFPKMWALRTKVAEHPKIKPMYESAEDPMMQSFKP